MYLRAAGVLREERRQPIRGKKPFRQRRRLPALAGAASSSQCQTELTHGDARAPRESAGSIASTPDNAMLGPITLRRPRSQCRVIGIVTSTVSAAARGTGVTVDAAQERASNDKLYVCNNDGSNAALYVLVLAKPCCFAAAMSAKTASLVRLLSGTVAAADGFRTMHTVAAVEMYWMTFAGFAQATRAVMAGGLAACPPLRSPFAKTASLCPTRTKKKRRRRGGGRWRGRLRGGEGEGASLPAPPLMLLVGGCPCRQCRPPSSRASAA